MIALRWRLIGISWLLGVALSTASAAQQRYRVAGEVRGPSGPLGGATVEVRAYDTGFVTLLEQHTLTTDGAGHFAATVPPSLVEVDVTPPAGSGLIGEQLRNLNAVHDLELRLTLPRAVSVSGRVEPSLPWSGETTLELYSLTRDRFYSFALPHAAATFHQLAVAADLYAVHAKSTDGGFVFGRTVADCRNGDVSGLRVPLAESHGPLVSTVPPRAALIQVGAADADGIAVIAGAAGAAQPSSALLVVNLDTGQLATGTSAADGSFTITVFAPPGSFVLVRQDPSGRFLTSPDIAPGTILYVPPAPGTFAAASSVGFDGFLPELRISSIQALGHGDPGQVWISGTGYPSSAAPGTTLTYRGRLVVLSRHLGPNPDPSPLAFAANGQLDKLSDAQGRQRAGSSQFMSTLMTPTGLPIEVAPHELAYGAPADLRLSNLRATGPFRVEGDFTLDLVVPPSLPPGGYRPRIYLQVGGLPSGGTFFDGFPSLGGDRSSGLALPALRVGSPLPPRHYWLLAMDERSNGTRGVVANEDRGGFRFASHVMVGSESLTLPRVDEAGNPISYRLGPYVPLVSSNPARKLPASPRIPFRFPSGALSLRIEKPDGTVLDLGSLPFVQSAIRGSSTRGGGDLASPRAGDLYQLLTAHPEVVFDQYGLHRVVATGTIEDVWGNAYTGGGTYEIWVARPLDLEPAVFPGTPFEVGDAISPAVVVQPGVPADVEVEVRLLPDSDPARAVVSRARGQANRFGFFNPVLAAPIAAGAAGEYRFDVRARYWAADGTLWMGAATWGSVVETPGSPLIAHGRRGFDNVDAIQQQWFLVREARAGGDHVMFPFHRGDVMWMERHDPAADIPRVSVQDPVGDFAQRVRNAFARGVGLEPPALEERITAGEIPLFTTCDGCLVPFDPDRVTQWGYSYGFAERPGVRVREVVSEDASPVSYWRFINDYDFQLGSGESADLPNDFKLHLGGAVWREPGFAYYGAYASLFVLLPIPDAVGGRVFPPFQGNGGGPSGGPIMTLKGRAIDLFWLPTAVRPGSILEVGDRVSFAGYFAPTLPSRLELTVTSPAGHVRTLTRQASKIGYLYDPAFDFHADEPGRWKVKVRGFFDGVTSAGQVTAPFPAGDVLGTADGELSFYVVRRDAPPLGVAAPAASFVRPAAGALQIALASPPGLSQTKVHETTTMPGFLLEQRQLSGLSYVYDAPRLAQDFPNLDLFDADGRAGVDTVTMSFLASGKDAGGADLFRARQLLLQGEELFAPAQEPQWPCVPGDTTLCLNQGRFEVTGTWRDFAGQPGVAHAVPLTSETGYLWFFSPQNVEVLLKVLDACGVNQRLWVFAAGLTSVETEIRVRDTLTGNVQVYGNTAGTAFAPLQDTSAFPTCDAPPAPAAAATTATSPSEEADGSAASSSTCVPGPNNLCLTGGRFRVEARWRTATGASGDGVASPLTTDTGTFWFFGPTNLEVVVKVLDACGFPGAPRFWVFAAGLTDVEVTLTVTDTATGVVKTYSNPLGTAFRPVQDTGAFATCS